MFDWIYILFFITLSQAILFFILFGKNILSPSVIAALMFSLSEFIAILNDNWGHPISELTTFVIISTIFTIAVGEAFALGLTPKRNININYTLLSDLNINNKKLFLVILFQFFILIYYYNALKDIAPFGDNIIAEARNARLNGELLDKKATWLKNFSYIFAYIFSFIFLYRYVFFNKKNLLFITPPIIYLATTTLEGNRLELIFIIAFWIIIGSYFYLKKNNWNPKCNIKIIKNAFFIFIIFLGVFIFLGSFKYANIMDNALHHIGFYMGMSIPSLDEYLIDGRISNEYFGEHTLISFYMFISRFSGTIYENMSPHLDFVCFNDTCGNVYTFIGRYHRDFGYFGVYFIVFIIGFFYRIFFEFVKNKNDFSILLFALLYSPIFNVAIDDVFFFKFASIGYLVLIFLMYISYRILITRKTL